MSNAIRNQCVNVPLLAAAALTKARFVSLANGVPAAGAKCLGVGRYTVAQGECQMIDQVGETYVEAGAAIAAGAEIQTDASGRAITLAAGVKLGTLSPLPTNNVATAAGQLVAVLLVTN
jgi:hypothetical protein